MTDQHAGHAQEVVDRFRDMLEPEWIKRFEHGHFDALALLIEAAIDDAILEAEENIIGQFEALTQEIRADPDRFDPD